MHIGVLHLLHQYGYFGVFFMLTTEMIGAPFPAETTLTLCGIAWAKGVFAFVPLWIVAAFANMVGSSVAYAIGYYLGRPMILKWGRIVGITESRLTRAEAKFAKRRGIVVLVGKFISGVRVATPLIAGMNRMNFVSFTGWNSASALCWSAFFILEGRYLSVLWRRYHPMITHHAALFVGLVVVLVVGMGVRVVGRYVVRRVRARARDGESHEDAR